MPQLIEHYRRRELLIDNTWKSYATRMGIGAHAVYWPETIVMLVAATIGGYGGAQIGRRTPTKVVRAGLCCLQALSP